MAFAGPLSSRPTYLASSVCSVSFLGIWTEAARGAEASSGGEGCRARHEVHISVF